MTGVQTCALPIFANFFHTVPSAHKYGEDLADNRRVVHLRMNTRTDADGNKVLFLEEVQSDWGQKGKKDGVVEKIDKNKKRKFSTIHLTLHRNNP